MSKKRKKKQKKQDILFWIILLVIIFTPFFFYQQRNKEINNEEVERFEKIDPIQYKFATFSDSFSGEAWVDMEKTSLVFSQKEMSFVFPDLEEDLTGSLSEDLKSQKQSRQIVSKKVNFNVDKIKAARIDKSENSEINSQIQYSFSNDGGINWMDIDIRQKTYFQHQGNDLRWRAIISPIQKDFSKKRNFSKISSINLSYWYEK